MASWWQQCVVYQVYPRSFQDTNGDGVGDLRGIIRRLDYLKRLGVDVIWLNPIYASGGVDAGYDISDYQAIDPMFGTMADFEELLREAHSRQLRIVMDLVVNHTSAQHPWFTASRASRDNPKRDWYIWRDGFEGKAPNGLQTFFCGSAWDLDEATGQYYLHNFMPQQPDLNWENPEVRQSIYAMMRWWLDKGIDGFRMDVISLISKDENVLARDGQPKTVCANGPRVHEFLQEMNRETFAHYDTLTVGETAKVTVEEAKRYAGLNSGELSMVFQFELMEAADKPGIGKWNTDKIPLPTIRRIMSKWQTGLHGQAWNSLYWSNHDQPRCVSRFGSDAPAYREKSAKMLATCLHGQQGTPYVFQGEELGMTNSVIHALTDCRDCEIFSAYHDLVEKQHLLTHEQMMAAIQEHSRDHARTPMQWDDTPNAGFSETEPWLPVNPNYREINAARQVADEHSVFNYYRRLIALRKELPVLVEGDYRLLLPDDPALFAYERTLEDTVLTVVCNFTDATVPLSPTALPHAKDARLLICNEDDSPDSTVPLRPYEARIYLNT